MNSDHIILCSEFYSNVVIVYQPYIVMGYQPYIVIIYQLSIAMVYQQYIVMVYQPYFVMVYQPNTLSSVNGFVTKLSADLHPRQLF